MQGAGRMSDHCHDKSRRLQEPRSVPSLALAMASLTYKMCEFGAVLGKCQWNKRLGRSFALAWVPGFRHSLDSTKRMSSCAARLARRGRFDQRNHSEFFSSWRAEEISTGGAAAELPRGAKTHSAVELESPELFFRQFHILGDSNIRIYGLRNLGPTVGRSWGGRYSQHRQLFFSMEFTACPPTVQWPLRVGSCLEPRPSVAQARWVRGVTAGRPHVRGKVPRLTVRRHQGCGAHKGLNFQVREPCRKVETVPAAFR